MSEQHLIPVESDRGFLRLPEITGTYPGSVRVYESSGAMRPQLWLCVKQPEDLNRPDGPWVDATVHLAVEDALKLAEQITYLAEHHYQIADDEKREAARETAHEATVKEVPDA